MTGQGTKSASSPGACVLYVGGNANNAGNAGAGYFNVNNGLGNYNANIGARLTKEVKYGFRISAPALQVNGFQPAYTLVTSLNEWGILPHVFRKGQMNMKRIGYIFDQLVSVENLREAHIEAKRSRKPNRRKGAIRFEKNLEENLLDLHERLVSETWRMHEYRCMVRIERGKRREIFYSPAHEDSIVQHAILRTLGKRIEKTLIRDTYASIKKRGTDDGIDRLITFILAIPDGENVYVWKIDLRQFYKSIKHYPLCMAILSAVKERKAARLLFFIVESHMPGIPIGNPISPLFANLLVSEFDHTVKEKFRFKGYFRYLDDIVVVATGEDAKERLKALSAYAHEYFAGIGLDIKGNEQIFPIDRFGIDFLGYVIGRKKMVLRKKTERRFRRAAARFKRCKTPHNRKPLDSYWGILKRMPRGLRLWFSLFTESIYNLETSNEQPESLKKPAPLLPV